MDGQDDQPDELDIPAMLKAERRKVSTDLLIAAICACDREDAAQIMCAALEEIGAGMPSMDLFMGNLRADAEFWADIATPQELEAFVAAGLRKIERTAFAEVTRKRIFMTNWESFSDADRRNFLTRVDPNGKFVGKR